MKPLLNILLVLLIAVNTSCNSPQKVFIAINGNDNLGNGSKEAPFATLERARDEIRKIKEDVKGQHTYHVLLREGTYFRNQSFKLSKENSGEKNFPIIYKAYNDEKVIIHGGVKIPISKAHDITESTILNRLDSSVGSEIVEIDLNLNDYGKIRPVGFARPFGPAAAELFVNEKPYTLARWPNNSTLPMDEVLDRGSIPRDGDFSNRGGTFKFDTERPKKWKNQKDIWITGYFFRGWAEDAVELKEIDTINAIFKTKQPSLYGFGSGAKFRRWHVYNILEEIDEPGEYYIDRDAGKVYFYPSDEIKELEISILEQPLVSIKEASNIRFDNIYFECSRGMGIYMEKTNNNIIENCTFKNLGIVGVAIGKGVEPFKELVHEGKGEPASDKIGSYLQQIYADPVFNRKAGTNNGVVNCTIYNTSAGGIHLGGGNRMTLEPANNYVENCTIHDFNRLEKSYRAGIDISGVGNRISNCEIYNAPSMAILLHGNDHLIEYNEIHDVCQEVHDQGALYYGRDPSERGHVVRYNYFHHLNSPHATSAVYHDDGACGMEVFGNVFYKPGSIPVLIGGGHNNPYTNNIFIDAKQGIHIDNRNQGWSRSVIAEGGIYEQRLKLIKHRKPPYSVKYPNLAKYWNDEPSLPKRNTVSKNIFYNVKKTIDGNKDWLPFLEDNYITTENPGFVDEENGNFMLKENAKVFSKVPGFEQIPFDKIGVQKRTSN